MTTFVFANNVQTTLAAAATTLDTTLTLSSSANLPTLAVGEQMPITLNNAATGTIYEICYVTAITGATLTVIRGREGTAAQNWSIGDYAFSTLTAGTAGLFVQSSSVKFRYPIEIIASYGTYPASPSLVADTQVMQYDKSTDESASFSFPITDDFDLTKDITLNIRYTGTVASNNFYIQLGYQVIGTGALSPASYTDVDEAMAAPATAGDLTNYVTTTAIIPYTALVANGFVNCVITRLATNALDTNTGSLQIVDITLEQ